MDVVRRVRDAITIYPGNQAAGRADRVPAGDPVGDRTTEPYALVSERGPWGGQGRRGWIFAAIWLVYLGSTLKYAWEIDDLSRRIAGVVLVLVFAVVYIFVFLIARKQRWLADAVAPRRQQALVLGTMFGITVATVLVIGQDGTSLLVYDAVACVLMLSAREAWVAVFSLIATVEILSHTIPGWEPEESLSFSIFLAGLAIWGISQVIARNRQLATAQDEIARMAVNAERTRFARDLHDLLGHSLTVVTVKAELAGRLISIDPARAEQEIADVERLARDALADVRAAVAGYREVSLAAELISARTALDAAGIEAELPGALDDVPGDARELFGWALREGVTNVVRHSGASRCRVLLTGSAIEIVDDGQGPVASEPPAGGRGGSGLLGLGERAEAVGARITVGRAGDDGGFRLRVGW